MGKAIKDYIQSRVDELEAEAAPPTQIGLKIPPQKHEHLVALAKELEMSKTALANKLLSHAIDEAFEFLNMPDSEEENES